MNSEEVSQEAKEQRSSIDPSESRSQRKVLVQKLQQALENTDNQLTQNTDSNGQNLMLRTFLKLPKPLKPLDWTFALYARGANFIAQKILQPCLHEASILEKKLQSLRNAIKSKDHVLMKLLERIENSGTDLSLIFPGITGLKSRRGTVSVAEAKKHVAGMAEFNESSWSSNFDDDALHKHGKGIDIHNLVSGCEMCPEHTIEEHEHWFSNLSTKFQNPTKLSSSNFNESKAVEASSRDVQSSDEESTASEDDEFERQATPPGQNNRHVIANKEVEDGDEDEEAEVQLPPKKRAKLGQLPQATSATKEDRANGTHSNASTATESEAGSESDVNETAPVTRNSRQGGLERPNRSSKQGVSPRDSSPPDSETRASTSKRRLGRLKKKTEESRVGSSATSSPETQPKATASARRNDDIDNMDEDKEDRHSPKAQTSSTEPPARRLGRLGGSKKTGDDHGEKKSPPSMKSSSRMQQKQDTEMPKRETSRSQSPSSVRNAKAKKEPTPQPEETAEQKADRRREELKKRITAAPVRKKRKF